MSILKLTPDFFENMSITANPVRTFSSSSDSGVTGSVFIFAERSPSFKDTHDPATPFTDFVSGSIFSDDSIEDFRLFAVSEANGNIIPSGSLTGSIPTNITSTLTEYMTLVSSQSVSRRRQKAVEIIRFEPSVRFTSDTLRKNVVKDTLFPYYRSRYRSMHWSYTNYHTLNFFTSSDVPSDSVLVYPALSTNTQNVSSSKGGPQFAKWEIERAGWSSIGEGSAPNDQDKLTLWDSLGQPLDIVFEGSSGPSTSVASASSGRASVTASIGGNIPEKSGIPVSWIGTEIQTSTEAGAWYRAYLTAEAIYKGFAAGHTRITADPPTTGSATFSLYDITSSNVSKWPNYGASAGQHGADGVTGVDTHLEPAGTPPTSLITSGNFYPNDTRLLKGENPYLPSSGAFSFEFYINPRYTCDDPDGYFTAGTIMHMSSTFAVSLVSGSSRDINGYTDGFRLLLQLSHSAEISPSDVPLSYATGGYAKTTSYPNVGANQGDLIFLSSDNSLKKNNWHHVCVRWGADFINDGTGSFVIDGVSESPFTIASSSVFTDDYGFSEGGTQADADGLFIGNFFDGSNNAAYGSLIAEFFNSHAARTQGTTDAFNGTWPSKTEYITTKNGTAIDYEPEPNLYNLDHPLNAEVHELKIFDTYRTIGQIKSSSAEGTSTLESGLLFYVPPFFVKETREREVMQTPFQTYKTTTDDPFNVALSFGVDGHLINLENFCREFVLGEYPRLMSLTASTIDQQTNMAKTANEFLLGYTGSGPGSERGATRKRNLTILPNDNGKYFPDFTLLASGAFFVTPPSGSITDKYTNDFGTLDYSLVSLTDLLPSSSLMQGLFQYPVSNDEAKKASTTANNENAWVGGKGPESEYSDDITTGSIVSGIVGATPETPGVPPGAILTVFQRTRDSSSNAVVLFDISNMFYGNKIKPFTFKIKDTNLTGSGGKVSITMMDDGEGSLYRSNATTSHAKWSSIGNIIYDEGIVVVKTPNLPKFGQEQFEVDLQGSHNIHMMEIHVPCPKGIINSSSNPSYKNLVASDYASDDHDFVYITGINFHDENLNVIARTNLAQPIVKRDDDKFMFRVKLDF